MDNENVTTDGGQHFVDDATRPDAQDTTLDVSLRSLRLRHYEAQSLWSPSEGESEKAALDPEAEEPEVTDIAEADESATRFVEETVEENEEKSGDISLAFSELSQEVRRLGREMFRINRVSERNQEIFDEAITEIRHLSSTVALI